MYSWLFATPLGNQGVGNLDQDINYIIYVQNPREVCGLCYKPTLINSTHSLKKHAHKYGYITMQQVHIRYFMNLYILIFIFRCQNYRPASQGNEKRGGFSINVTSKATKEK